MMYDREIRLAAQQRNLDADLITAMVRVESDGNPWAWNPEPSYRYLYDVRKQRPFRPLSVTEAITKRPPADFHALAGDPDQEWWGQQASWGLMQVMGALARELGFRLLITLSARRRAHPAPSAHTLGQPARPSRHGPRYRLPSPVGCRPVPTSGAARTDGSRNSSSWPDRRAASGNCHGSRALAQGRP